ncbi:multidrug ABC transporter ATP-binding protein [Aerococcus urinaehominis]|uniref:Multidrug ABC transporter ATP-binding protein n=1 Tax=Aerococcus urinaehominis TaxID=128944 RepID=A0A0X8FJZ8_9LACT|nr:ABC transporter ATP-binding protein [Aerococcus urinaehominis]AMB98652.1 multidrug ABC transporter ATP-binding protein [Aerococcus urinaehominis]SDL97021.1 ATP-binding cassette, subfamily B [Aerococcus urinaehominis]
MNHKLNDEKLSLGQTCLRLFHYFGSYKLALVAVIIATSLATIMTTLAPAILGQATTVIVDGVNQGQQIVNGQAQYVIDFNRIGQIVSRVLMLYLLAGAARFVQNALLAFSVQGMLASLRQDMRNKLNTLPVATVDAIPNGEILSRAINDVENMGRTLPQMVSQTVMSVLQFFGVLVMIFLISWKISLVVLFLVGLVLFFISKVAPYSQKLFSQQQKSEGELNAILEEDYNGQLEIKAFNQQEKRADYFQTKTDDFFASASKAQFISGIMMPLSNSVRNLSYVTVALLGGIAVINGQLTVGQVQALIQYNPQLFQPLSQMANIVNLVQDTLASARRVFTFLDLDDMTDEPSGYPAIETDKTMIFDQVDFGYQADKMIIKDFNLQVNPGETIAIVGPTGAGKTTLINLIERFYDVSAGSIKFKGKDIRDIDRADLRDHISMVLQDTWLFTGSLYDNIAYGGDESTTKADVMAAAKTAHVDDFARKLPDGYDTIINEDASNLSQGQRQLVTIARSLVNEPEILILDEATSSIDTRTEKLIQTATEKLLAGRTSFVIAHRLSTIRDADKILVMDQGQIIEMGNHDQLMEKRGFYYNLYQAQFEEAFGDD